MNKKTFLKQFDKWSEKFYEAIDPCSHASIDWSGYSDDFINFVIVGKLPHKLTKKDQKKITEFLKEVI